jgi:acyl dehydratase
MQKRFFEDFLPGMTMQFGPRLVTREEVAGFAAEFDPQPMHLDEAAGRQSLLDGLGGSGWHTVCLTARMLAEGLFADTAAADIAGVDEIKWLSPLRPDSRLAVMLTVLDTRASDGRPDHGLVAMNCDVTDQFQTLVMRLIGTLTVGRRAAAGSAG